MQIERFKRTFVGCALLGWLAFIPAIRAEETLPVLRVGTEIYSNVTVTSVSATDIYFSHSRGMGNAKLKNLTPDLQKRFHFDPVKAGEAEKKQYESAAQFHEEWANRKPAVNTNAITGDSDDADIVVPELYAKSFRGQRPPQIVVDTWLTPVPDFKDKFVLVEFWRSSAEPCIQAIPHLNDLYARFYDRVVIISLTDDPQEVVRKVNPVMRYYIGLDPQARTMMAMQVRGIPHAILIDPKGIVRFEGMPAYLDETKLKRLLDKYSSEPPAPNAVIVN
jgi:cytochrome c biogenesis protein CcmG, thiol:disulfide interchange protein DsbE